MAPEAQVGRWSQPFELSNVAVHASLLPNGKVLYWGRRQNPKKPDANAPAKTDLPSLHELFTKAFVWDPKTNQSKPTANSPRGTDGKEVNLFCGGHAFLPDGTLLIAGGHIIDGTGVNSTCIYDPATDTFTPKPPMIGGRWYPSVLPLPDGRALVMSGSKTNGTVQNISQIWSSNGWVEVTDPLNQLDLGSHPILPLYPRMHLTPTGRVIMVGPPQQSWFLDVDKKPNFKPGIQASAVIGAWANAGIARAAGFRDYCPTVHYDTGKIMYIGGGEENVGNGPTKEVEFLEFDQKNPQAVPKWTKSPSSNLKVGRRQSNATVLPDGTVLVTGGTNGSGFNDLTPGAPVHRPELWDPTTKKWTDMADESVDRCYHSIALLLPDGKVLSAGGGEYDGAGPKDNMTNAQLFSPPYLFKGPRPTIASAPSEIVYGENFTVTLGSADPIAKVSWVRLGSVTHCRNMNQSLMFLSIAKQTGPSLSISAPANGNLAPPGHYMLFVLNKQGVPSVAKIIRIAPRGGLHTLATPAHRPAAETHCVQQQPSLEDHKQMCIAEQDRPPVVIGITPICPYGLSACWAGAYDGLNRMRDIDVVSPMANQDHSLAFVYLGHDGLPDIDAWRKEFAQTVNSSYKVRGIEMTLSGAVSVRKDDGKEQVVLAGTGTRPQVLLAPFREGSQIKWDIATGAPKPVDEAEAGAYGRLLKALVGRPKEVPVKVTGTLQRWIGLIAVFSLDVRKFEVLDATS